MSEKRNCLTFFMSRQENIRKENRWPEFETNEFLSRGVNWALVILSGLYWESQLPPYSVAILTTTSGRLSLLYIT